MIAPALAAIRRHDWQLQFDALVCGRLHAPFWWGLHDCCLWAADAVHAVTGVDLAADLRGTYGNELQAARVLQAHGGLVGLAVARLGPVVSTAMAQPGDVGLVLLERRESLAICAGGHWLAPGPQGLVPIAGDQVRRAWRCTRG